MWRWLRWQGLVAFIVLVVLLAGGWWLFADRLVKWAVEGAGTAMVGARVELAGADVALAPLRLELTGLQVTNPRAPMRNAFEVRRIAFDADTLGLLLDRTDIAEMAVEGLRLNTPRQRSGAVSDAAEQGPGLLETGGRRLEIPTLEMPSVDQALTAVELRSPAAIDAARTEVQARREALGQRLDALPDRATLKGYDQRLERIRQGGGDLAGRLSQAREAKALLEAVRADLKAVRRARDAAREGLAAAEQRAREARQAPEDDVRRLVQRYSDPATVAQELARYVLGPRLAGWLNGGWYWYQRLAPYLGRLGGDGDAPPAVKLPRGGGRRVLFPETDPRPSLLVRRVGISGGYEQGSLGGEITDIAAPARLWNRPLRFELRGADLPGLAALRATGVRQAQESAPRTELSLRIDGALLPEPSQPPDSGVAITAGLLDLRVEGTVVGERLDLTLDGRLREAAFAVAADGGERLREMARLLQGVSSFDLSARVTGTAAAPELALRSSLAQALRSMVGQVAGEKVRAFREALMARIAERVAEPLATLDDQLQSLREIEQAIAERQQRLEALEDRLGRITG